MACGRPGRLLGMCVGVVEGPLAEIGVGGCSGTCCCAEARW